jgi:flagellar motility protein MotE (MotC chaperone)
MPPIRDFQLIPVAVLATAGLFALKVFGLVVNGGYVLTDTDATASGTKTEMPAPLTAKSQPPSTVPAPPPVRTRYLQARDLLSLFDITGATDAQKSGAAPAKSEAAASAKTDGDSSAKASGAEPMKMEGSSPAKMDAATPMKTEGAAAPKAQGSTMPKPTPAEPTPNAGGTVIQADSDHPVSPAERAILEHLQTRRQELDARAREIDIRNNLLKEAEGRLQTRATELKGLEGEINAATQKKDEAEAARLKGLVIMYENMKPKDAAKIFDRLDMKILVDLVTQINPRKMSDIMAQMQPEMAERLTAELASKGAGADKGPSIDNLPKIEGKPPETQADPNPN